MNQSPVAPPSASESQLVLSALERLERRLDRIEGRLDRFDALAERAPPLLATIVDSADQLVDDAQARGVDTDARLRAALRMAERLTAPETMQTLDRVLGALEAAPALMATVVDTLDGLVERAGDAGLDVHERLELLASAAERLTSPTALGVVREVLARADVVERLLESGVLDEAPVALMAKAAYSLAETCAEHPAPLGPWAALRALREPGVQRTVGFALRFARRFGEAIHADESPRRLTAPSSAA
jgi:uncharacterized protein YjgD (DUF1641 family)